MIKQKRAARTFNHTVLGGEADTCDWAFGTSTTRLPSIPDLVAIHKKTAVFRQGYVAIFKRDVCCEIPALVFKDLLRATTQHQSPWDCLFVARTNTVDDCVSRMVAEPRAHSVLRVRFVAFAAKALAAACRDRQPLLNSPGFIRCSVLANRRVVIAVAVAIAILPDLR